MDLCIKALLEMKTLISGMMTIMVVLQRNGCALNIQVHHILTLSEVYKCDKDGKLFDETIDTEYNFSLGGSDCEEIIKQLLEKCVIVLNNSR